LRAKRYSVNWTLLGKGNKRGSRGKSSGRRKEQGRRKKRGAGPVRGEKKASWWGEGRTLVGQNKPNLGA